MCAVLRPSSISPRPTAPPVGADFGVAVEGLAALELGLAAIGVVALVCRLGADPDRGCDLAPARSQRYGFAGQLVTRLDGALDFKLGLPGAVKHRALLV